jgi:hypothetical protein
VDLQKAYLANVQTGANLNRYRGLWMLAYDMMPYFESTDTLKLYVYRACNCTMDAWVSREWKCPSCIQCILCPIGTFSHSPELVIIVRNVFSHFRKVFSTFKNLPHTLRNVYFWEVFSLFRHFHFFRVLKSKCPLISNNLQYIYVGKCSILLVLNAK